MKLERFPAILIIDGYDESNNNIFEQLCLSDWNAFIFLACRDGALDDE